MSENVNKNLDENLESADFTSEKESQILGENATKTLCKAEQNMKVASCNANWAKILVKKTLEISLQGAAGALVCTGKAGVWLGNLASELKDEAKKAELSRINEEQAKFDGTRIISGERVKEIIAKRLKTEASKVEFGQIYLGKIEAFDKASKEYYYETKAKFNDFLYLFKIAATGGEILNLKIKS